MSCCETGIGLTEESEKSTIRWEEAAGRVVRREKASMPSIDLRSLCVTSVACLVRGWRLQPECGHVLCYHAVDVFSMLGSKD